MQRKLSVARTCGGRERLPPRCVTGLWLSGLPPTHADETCMSPYMAKITGQEDVVYVWTLGAEGVGDGSDKLVTVDGPTSPTYGKVVHTASVGGRARAPRWLY